MATFVVKEGSRIGIKTPLQKSTSHGFFAANTEILAQEKQNLLNLLMTNFGERPIHYDLGVNIDHFLFEQETDILRQALIDNVTTAILKWLPHLTIRELKIFFKSDDNTLGENEIKLRLGFQLLDNPDMFDTIEILVGP